MLYFLGSRFLFVQHHYWLPVASPMICGVWAANFGILGYRVFFEGKEKGRVKAVFSKIVSPDVVNLLLSSDKLSLVGARRHITVFFADVRGFTEFTDKSQAAADAYVKSHGLTGKEAEAYYDAQAQETFNIVNTYIATIADMVKKHNGTLDKYIGDCVMAFWGSPIPNPSHALCCVRAAIDSQRAMHALNEARTAENTELEKKNLERVAAGQEPLPLRPLLSLGSGINTGIVQVGLMGSDAHIYNYTVFGREVNLASRLEGVSGRGRIVISVSTYNELLRDDPALAATCIELEPVSPKGFREKIQIYEVPWRTNGGTTAVTASRSAEKMATEHA
jgi:adenylate cyclase